MSRGSVNPVTQMLLPSLRQESAGSLEAMVPESVITALTIQITAKTSVTITFKSKVSLKDDGINSLIMSFGRLFYLLPRSEIIRDEGNYLSFKY